MNRTVQFLVSLAVLLVTGGVHADVFDRTGAQLAVDSGLSLPTVQPMIVGDAAIFGAGSASDIIFAIPLVPADALGDRPFRIAVSINMTRVTDDWDPYIVLSDGDRYAGVNVFDNESGGAGYVQGSIAGTSAPLGMTQVLFRNAGFPAVGEAIDIELVFKFDGTVLTSEISTLSNSGVYSSQFLDPTKPISMMLVRDNEGSEQYQLNSIRIQNPRPVVRP